MLFIFSQGWGAGYFFSGSGSRLFFQRAPAPAPAPAPGFVFSGYGSKEPKTPGSGSPALAQGIVEIEKYV